MARGLELGAYENYSIRRHVRNMVRSTLEGDIYIYIYIYIYVYIYIYIYIYMYIHIHAHIRVHIHILYTHVYISRLYIVLRPYSMQVEHPW